MVFRGPRRSAVEFSSPSRCLWGRGRERGGGPPTRRIPACDSRGPAFHSQRCCRVTAAPRTVLYIQHAAAPGGSAMSLLYTMQALDRARYHPVVALVRPADALARLYEDAGIRTVPWPG